MKEQEWEKWSYLSSFLTSPRLVGAPPSRISPENAKVDANVREEKGKWENEVGTRRKFMKMKEPRPLTARRLWPPANEASGTGKLAGFRRRNKEGSWGCEKRANRTEIEGERGEGRPRQQFSSQSPSPSPDSQGVAEGVVGFEVGEAERKGGCSNEEGEGAKF